MTDRVAGGVPIAGKAKPCEPDQHHRPGRRLGDRDRPRIAASQNAADQNAVVAFKGTRANDGGQKERIDAAACQGLAKSN